MHYLLGDIKKLKWKLVFHGYWTIQTFSLFHMPPCWDVGTRWYLHWLYTSEYHFKYWLKSIHIWQIWSLLEDHSKGTMTWPWPLIKFKVKFAKFESRLYLLKYCQSGIQPEGAAFHLAFPPHYIARWTFFQILAKLLWECSKSYNY